MHIHLDQWFVTDALEAMDFPGFNDQDVARSCIELLAVHYPEPAASSDELDFIVRMTMRTRAAAREGSQEEDGDVDVAMVHPDELVGAATKR